MLGSGSAGFFGNEVVTMYVGKIPKTIPDEMIKKFLECCGKLNSWSRLTNPYSGEFNPFGYAKFASIGDALSAIRILNGYEIQGHKLLLKVDDATREKCTQYERITPPQQFSSDPGIIRKIESYLREFEALDEGETLDQDDPTMKAVPSVAGDKEKADIVTSEIKRFREQQAQMEKERQERQQKAMVSVLEADKEQIRKREKQVAMIREDRMHDVELLKRKKEQEERAFLEAERYWEVREKDMAHEKQRFLQKIEDIAKKRYQDISNENGNDDTWHRHVADSYRKRMRRKEYDWDRSDRLKEEEELARQQTELAIVEEERKKKEAQEAQEKEERARLWAERESSGPIEIKLAAEQKKRPLSEILEDDVAENQPARKKKRHLVKLDYAEAGLLTEEDKRRDKDRTQAIIQKIPVDREPLFAYPIDWLVIEKNDIIAKNVKGWLTAKVIDYCVGEKEVAADLETFILRQLAAKASAQTLFEELQPALGEETELFVKLLWRLMIFHIISSSEDSE